MSTAAISYWREVSRIPVLSAEEQLILARRFAATRDRRLAHQLVRTNLRLVAKIARELATSCDNLDDLIQEGNAGLLVAVERFDPNRGAALVTYAGWWIRAFIKRYQMEHRGVVRTGTTRAQRRDFHAGPGARPDVSLDQPIRSPHDDSAARTRLALLQGRDEDRPDRMVEERDFQLKLGQLVSRFQDSLDVRGRTIVRDRWRREHPATLRKVAKRFSLSAERARQIEGALLDRFKALAFKELAASFLLVVAFGVALGACAAAGQNQPAQQRQLAEAVAVPPRLGPPEQLSPSARALLRARMAWHTRNMTNLVSAIMVLHYPQIQEDATAIASDASLSRPLSEDATELNSALPEKFFLYQDSLRLEAKTLAEAASRENPFDVADAYGRLSQNCVRCHATYRAGR